MQAQDLRGARLAVRSRTRGLHVSDVDRALADRELVVAWLCRGTLHLVQAEDLRLAARARHTTAARARARRRLAQEGVPPDDAERGVAAVVRALAGGPAPRGACARP